MAMKNKLARFKTQIARDGEKKDVRPAAAAPPAGPPLHERWQEAGVRKYEAEGQTCLIKETTYPLDHLHGNYRFADFPRAMEIWEGSGFQHDLSGYGYNPQDLFFFDTETTGLGGGTGNVIFLLGHARVTDGKVTVKQHFLPEPGNEVALYKSFLESADYTTLVSYNGKSFDWPQVKTRHTLVREHVPKLPAFAHFDLYHAARRMWKGRLDRIKLSVVEKEILGFEREDDVPGYLAPMIYFDYVERKDPEAILKVMKHNELDILSLITLYVHLTFQIHRIDPNQTPGEVTRIGNWFEKGGQKKLAETAWREAAAKEEPEAKFRLAFSEKRAGNFPEAAALWKHAAETPDRKLQAKAYIELAKLMEHQQKDLKQALSFTEKAIMAEEGAAGKSAAFLRDARKRKERLVGKCSK